MGFATVIFVTVITPDVGRARVVIAVVEDKDDMLCTVSVVS